MCPCDHGHLRCSGWASTCSLGPMGVCVKDGGSDTAAAAVAPPWRRMGPHRHSASSGRCSDTHRVGSLGSLWELRLWSVRFAVSRRPGMQVAHAGLRLSGTWSLCPAFSRSRSRYVGNHTAAMMGSGGQSPTPSCACSATSRLAAGSEINAGGLPPPCAGSRQLAGFKVREELASGHNCHLPPLPFHLALPSRGPGR